MSDKKHHRLSPSAAHRWMVCPGEVNARESVPNVSSSYADEGTTAHWVGEQCLRDTTKDPRFFIGTICPETNLPITADMIYAVEQYIDHCRALIAVADWYGIETTLELADLSEDCGGTADFPALVGDMLIVDDYKHGQGYDVDPVDNPQALIYALGAIRAMPKGLRVRVKRVAIQIIQPRAGGIKTWEISISQLISWQEEKLKPAIQATIDRPNERHAGEHCRFCPVRATCPAVGTRALAVAQMSFEVIDPPTLPSPETVPFDKLVEILKHKEVIEGYLKSIEAHVQNQLQSGVSCDDFKLVAKRSDRAWAVPESFVVQLLGEEAYAPRKLISPAKAEEILKGVGIPVPPDYIFKPDNGTTMAPMNDKRKAVQSAIQAFTPIEDETSAWE